MQYPQKLYINTIKGFMEGQIVQSWKYPDDMWHNVCFFYVLNLWNEWYGSFLGLATNTTINCTPWIPLKHSQHRRGHGRCHWKIKVPFFIYKIRGRWFPAPKTKYKIYHPYMIFIKSRPVQKKKSNKLCCVLLFIMRRVWRGGSCNTGDK